MRALLIRGHSNRQQCKQVCLPACTVLTKGELTKAELTKAEMTKTKLTKAELTKAELTKMSWHMSM